MGTAFLATSHLSPAESFVSVNCTFPLSSQSSGPKVAILFLGCKLEIFWGAEDTEIWGPTSRDSDLIGSDCNMKPGVRTTDRLWASTLGYWVSLP